MTDQTFNQYAAPTAQVADVSLRHQATGEVKLFSAKGRIGRMRYLAYSTGASIVSGVAISGAAVALGAAGAGVAAFVLYAVLLWFHVITGIKRCHDINISGWWTLTMIIPVIALIWVFVPGTKGANRFGAPAPQHGLGVTILGLLFPLLVIGGIVAAIAIPSYADYTKRAGGTPTSVQP